MIKNIFKKQHILLLGLALLVLIEAYIYFFAPAHPRLSIEEYAEEVVATCKDASYRPTCYDKTIPELMNYISMEDAFKVTSIVQAKDRSYVYCHVLAHELSAREVVKNPAGWKDVVMRSPSGMCSNGGIHGAFQERFRGEFFTDEQLEAIKPELYDLCEKRGTWTPTGLEQASCYHAVGHLTMYLTEADLNRSIKLCDDLALKPNGRDYRQLCYDGAFMQIFQPLEPEDFSLIKGKEVSKEQHEKFCNKFTGAAKASCRTEGWPLYREDFNDPKFLTAYCAKSEPDQRERCFSAVMYVVTALFSLDINKVAAYCPGLEGDEVGKCFASAAGRLIEVDYRNIEDAVKLCTLAEPKDPKHFCLDMLLKFSTYNYKVGSPEFYKVCEVLPGEWGTKCLQRAK